MGRIGRTYKLLLFFPAAGRSQTQAPRKLFSFETKSQTEADANPAVSADETPSKEQPEHTVEPQCDAVVEKSEPEITPISHDDSEASQSGPSSPPAAGVSSIPEVPGSTESTPENPIVVSVAAPHSPVAGPSMARRPTIVTHYYRRTEIDGSSDEESEDNADLLQDPEYREEEAGSVPGASDDEESHDETESLPNDGEDKGSRQTSDGDAGSQLGDVPETPNLWLTRTKSSLPHLDANTLELVSNLLEPCVPV